MLRSHTACGQSTTVQLVRSSATVLPREVYLEWSTAMSPGDGGWLALVCSGTRSTSRNYVSTQVVLIVVTFAPDDVGATGAAVKVRAARASVRFTAPP
jgi:hypothetical protein